MSGLNIKVVDFKLALAPATFTQSLKNTGFAVLTNHPIKNDINLNDFLLFDIDGFLVKIL